jgi:O-antigen ligase
MAVLVGGTIRRPGVFHLFVVLFLIWNALTVLWSLDQEATIDRIKSYTQHLIMCMLLWDLITTRQDMERALHAFLAGAVVCIFSTISSFTSGVQAHYGRYSAAGFNADDAGMIIALGIPIAIYLRGTREDAEDDSLWHLLRSWLYLAYLPLALLGIGLTGTRTALVATLPGLVMALGLLSKLRPRQRVLSVVLVAGGIALVQPLVPQDSMLRLSSTASEITSGTLNGRTYLWSNGLKAFGRRPVGGSGSGSFPRASQTGQVAHNTPISVLTETGLVGLIVFTALVGLAVAAALRHPRRQAVFWLALLATWLIGSMALTWEPRKQTWLVLSLVVGSGYTVAARKPSPEGVPEGLPALA